jgi:hypothetical protein
MQDCRLIRFSKMLKKLKIPSKINGREGSDVWASDEDKNSPALTIPRGGTPQRRLLEHAHVMDRRGS